MALRTRTVAAGLAAAALSALAPAGASAATHVVRPDALVSGAGAWNVAPAGRAEWDALDDAVVAPALPVVGDDLVFANANGPRTFQVALANPVLGAGETVTGATAHAYLAVGSGRTLTVTLRTGGAVLATQTYAAGTPAGWRSVAAAGALTQATLDDLRLEFTLSGNGASSATSVYAAYGEISATDPPPPPPEPEPEPEPEPDPTPEPEPEPDPTPDPEPEPDPTPEPEPEPTPEPDPEPEPEPTPDPTPDPEPEPDPDPAESPISVTGTRLTASSSGLVPVLLSCTATTACTGTIYLESPGASESSLTAARRGKRFSKKRKYSVAPGKTATIPVRLDRRVHRKFETKRSFKAQVVIEQKDASGNVVRQRRTVRIFRAPRR